MVNTEDTSEPLKFSRSIDLLAAKHCRVHILTAEGPFRLEVWERRGGQGVDVDVLVGNRSQSVSFVEGRRGWSEPLGVYIPSGIGRTAKEPESLIQNPLTQAALQTLPESARRHIIPEK